MQDVFDMSRSVAKLSVGSRVEKLVGSTLACRTSDPHLDVHVIRAGPKAPHLELMFMRVL
jgi:hypothetical protein